ncbi:MAG: hypothetical protein IT334_07530 [Thermomicrobiales bacterium]|nr:hypothetical protein [Thermomicrobiales bacterium]
MSPNHRRNAGPRCLGIHLWKLLLTLGITISLMAGLIQSVSAEEGTPESDNDMFARSFLFHPAETGVLTSFSVDVEGGDSTKLTVLIGNNGTVTLDIRSYAVNVFTGDQGGMVAAKYGTESNEVSKWIVFPEETVTLEPGEGVERIVEVQVPEGTPPGEYIAAVAGEHADAYDVEGISDIRQRTRYVVPILITVPGDMNAAFRFGQPSLESLPDALVLRIPIHNDGVRHVRPSGEITLRDASGRTIATAPIAMQTVFARESATLTLGIPGGLPPGDYQIEGVFTDQRTGASAVIAKTTLSATVAATPEPTRYRISTASAVAAPATGAVQFVTVNASIINNGEPATGMQLSLIAFLDGEEVERFPINQSLSLPTGETPITTRYIPATGFTSGEWSFELVLETVTPSGAAVVVARTTIEETIAVGS